jgi:hypothetical protein
MSTSKTTPEAAKRRPKKTPAADADKTASDLIDARIAELADWRGQLLSRIRSLMRNAEATIVEEWKWNTPVWSSNGIICTGETYAKAVKLTFPKGASLDDPDHLFNASLEGQVRRAIDFAEGAPMAETALIALIRAAAALNKEASGAKAAKAAKTATTPR